LHVSRHITWFRASEYRAIMNAASSFTVRYPAFLTRTTRAALCTTSVAHPLMRHAATKDTATLSNDIIFGNAKCKVVFAIESATSIRSIAPHLVTRSTSLSSSRRYTICSVTVMHSPSGTDKIASQGLSRYWDDRAQGDPKSALRGTW
jgi:hypothetical protein